MRILLSPPFCLNPGDTCDAPMFVSIAVTIVTRHCLFQSRWHLLRAYICLNRSDNCDAPTFVSIAVTIVTRHCVYQSRWHLQRANICLNRSDNCDEPTFVSIAVTLAMCQIIFKAVLATRCRLLVYTKALRATYLYVPLSPVLLDAQTLCHVARCQCRKPCVSQLRRVNQLNICWSHFNEFFRR